MNVLDSKLLDDYLFIGELLLDGSIGKVNGVLPMCIEAKKLGFKRIIVPIENKFEASVIKDLEIYPAKNIEEVINHLKCIQKITPYTTNLNEYFSNHIINAPNFSSVKGQASIKRALEVAASGSHNCLLIGSPGSRQNNDGKMHSVNFARFNIR